MLGVGVCSVAAIKQQKMCWFGEREEKCVEGNLPQLYHCGEGNQGIGKLVFFGLVRGW